jgi:hypothetical protein
MMYHPQEFTTTLPEAIAGAILYDVKLPPTKKPLQTNGSYNKIKNKTKQLEYEEPWPVPSPCMMHYATALRLKESYTAYL